MGRNRIIIVCFREVFRMGEYIKKAKNDDCYISFISFSVLRILEKRGERHED